MAPRMLRLKVGRVVSLGAPLGGRPQRAAPLTMAP